MNEIMSLEDRLTHFKRWTEKNWDLTQSMTWEQLMDFYLVFKNTDAEYFIADCVEEHEGMELNGRYNTLATRYYGFNRFVNGEWETRF